MAYLGLFSHQLRLFGTACSQYQQLAATLLVLHRIQLVSDPPNKNHNLEGLRAIEFMKESIQSMDRSFRSLSSAAHATLLGNMGPGTTTPVENMGSVHVQVPFEQIPLEGQRPNTIHGANSNISTFHHQAAALGALCKPARRKRKQRLRKQLNKEPFTNTESWTGPSPSYPSDKRDIELSPIPVVKTEHEGTTPADLDDVHPSRRSQVITRPFLGRTTPPKGSKSLQSTRQAEGDREEVSFRSNDSATATEPHIEIEQKASPQSSLHSSPNIEPHISRGVEMLTNPFLETYSTGRSGNTTGTQSLAPRESMPAEKEDASAFASQYASIADHVMANQAKRSHNSDEEDITASKKLRCTVGSFLEQITERQPEPLPKTEAPPPHVTDEQSAVIMQVLAPSEAEWSRPKIG
ncbi:MAG: hypothetical protein Q9171_002855 [Xanthocarpia ochracea]